MLLQEKNSCQYYEKIRSYVSKICKRYFKLLSIKMSKAGRCWDVRYEKQYSIIATLNI